MHRLITNAPEGMEVDHRNHNGLDNRRGNLRTCTPTQHRQTRRPHKNTTSEYKGVWWHTQACKWQARISFRSKPIHIGVFGDEKEAAKAYNKKAKELFGKFAWLNDV